MGLDMYITRYKMPQGITLEEAQKIKRSLELKEQYERIYALVQDSANYDPDRFWSYVGESEDEKRERILATARDTVKDDEEAYKEAEAYLKTVQDKIHIAMQVTDSEYKYWRKANHIHAWFVNNVQDGIDECQESVLTVEHINLLKETVDKIIDASEERYEAAYKIKDYSLREAIHYDEELPEVFYSEMTEVFNQYMPTQSGFFFGGTSYSAHYLASIYDLRSMAEDMLEEMEDETIAFAYQASW